MTSQPGQPLAAAQSISTSDRVVCPDCGSTDLSLMIGGRHSGEVRCGQCRRVGLPIVQYAEVRARNWHQVAHEAVQLHRAIQDPDELGALLGYLAGQVRPLRVVEIGGAYGGSAWAWLQLPTVGQVVTVDLVDATLRNTPRPVDDRHTVVTGDSTLPSIVDTVGAILGDESADLIFIDGGHDYPTATMDWHNYAPFCSAGGIVAFHDILPWDTHPDMQVHAVWAPIRETRRTFEIIARPHSKYGIGVVIG